MEDEDRGPIALAVTLGSDQLGGGAMDALVTEEDPTRYRGEERELGRGGIGRVVAVVDAHLGREVARKELLGDALPLEESVSDVARFLREARVTGQLEHPGVVPVYELGRRADGALYYTMRVIRGRSLRARLRDAATLADRLALVAPFAQVCETLAYAHSRGVIHRDLKPENVMLGEFGETVVVDWGLAKVRGVADLRGGEIERAVSLMHADSGETQAGTMLGTPAYMSPEQVHGDLDAMDARTDVWALGAILYELLTGRSPFARDELGATLLAILEQDPPAIEAPGVPPELEAIARRALQRDPDRRYPSAKAMAEDVEAWLEGRRVGVYEYGSLELVRRFVARNRAASVASLALFVGALVAAALLVGSNAREQAARQLAEQQRAEAREAQAEAERGRREAQLEVARSHLTKARTALDVPDPAAAMLHAAAALSLDPDREGGDPEAIARRALAFSRYLEARSRMPYTVERFEGLHGELAADPTGARVVVARQAEGRVRASSALELWDLDAGTHRALDLGEVRDPQPTGLDGDLLAVYERGGGGGGVYDLAANEWRWREAEGSVSLAGAHAVHVADDGVRVRRAADGAVLAETRIPELRGQARARLSPDGAHVAIGGPSLRRTWLWTWRTGAAARRVELRSHAFAMGPTQLVGSDGSRRVAMTPYDGGPTRFVDVAVPVLDLDLAGDRFAARARNASLHPLDDPGRPVGVVHSQRRTFSPETCGFDGGLFLTTLDAARDDAVPDLFRVRWREVERATSEPHGRGRALVVTSGRLHALDDTAVLELDPETMQIRRRVPVPEEASPPTWLAVRAETIAVLGVGGDLWTWAGDAWTQRRSVARAGTQHAVVRTFGDGFLISGERGVDRLRADAAEVEPWAPSETRVAGLAVSPDALMVAAAEDGGDVVLYDAEGHELRRLPGHEGLASGVDFSPDGRHVATSDWAGWVMIWDARTGERLRRWRAHRYWVNEVLYSPDGTILATASDDARIRLWTAETGTLRRTLELDGWAMPMAFGPDGRHFFYPDEGRIVRVDARASIDGLDPEGLLARVEEELGIRLGDLVGEL